MDAKLEANWRLPGGQNFYGHRKKWGKMNQYRSIYPGFWTGRTGKEIRKKGASSQLLAIYLITCSHSHPTGLFYIPLCFMSHETGLLDSEVADALKELNAVGFCTYDYRSDWVYVKNMVKHQIGSDLQPGDKRIKWMETALENADKSTPKLTKEFLSKYKEAYNLFSDQKTPPSKKRSLSKKTEKPLPLQEKPEAPPKVLQEKKEAPPKGLQEKTEAPPKPDTDTDTDTDTEKKKKACPEPLRVAGPSSENPKNWQDDLAVQLQDAVFIQILTNKKGQTFSVNESRIQEWEELFPAVDIKQELRNLTAWSQANPTQRKTFGGMESFIVRWLKKEQNRGGPGPRGPDRPIEPGPRPTFKNPGELKIFEADFEARRQETQKMIQQIRDKYQAERSAGP